MKAQKNYYLIYVQYLGFRYSGWQKQPGHRTLESMVEKTLRFILPERNFKVLAAGRTDAKVSALETAFELFLAGAPLLDNTAFLERLNMNLPPDIKAQSIETVSSDFNIIQSPRVKTYAYLFSHGQKNHPYAAPFMANSIAVLDIATMQAAASHFEGTHDFKNYTARLRPNTKTVRTVTQCELVRNTILAANFLPETSYALLVSGPGFMRYQIRLMMGALFDVGEGKLDPKDIEESLQPESGLRISRVAPGSGLMIVKNDFGKN